MKSLLCVRFQESAPLGIVEDVLEQERVPWRYLDAWRDEPPPATDASGLIVLGGEMNVDDFDGYPFLKTVRDLVAESVSAGLPVLGICLGAQMLARALGAEVHRAVWPEVGFHDVIPTAEGWKDPVLAPFTGEFPVFQWHEDAFELSEGAVLLHRSASDGNQAFRIGERAYGVQFHFEVTEEIISSWCGDTDPDELSGYWGTSERELVAQARDLLGAQQRAGREAIARFLRLPSNRS